MPDTRRRFPSRHRRDAHQGRPEPGARGPLERALDALRAVDPELHQLARHRLFGRLDDADLAATLDLSTDRASREWRRARAFLYREIHGTTPDAGASGSGVPALPPTRWTEVAATFDRLLDLDPAGRVQALSRMKDEDPALRREVFALLVADAREGGVLEAPGPGVADDASRPHIGATLARALGLLLVGVVLAVAVAAWRSQTGEPPAVAMHADGVEATSSGHPVSTDPTAMDPVPSDPVPIDPDVAETAVPDPTPTIPDPTPTNPLDDGGRLEANEPDPVPDAEVDATLARARSVEGADAADAFREAIASLEEGDPRLIDAQMDLGRLLTEMGRAHEARPLLRRALADVPAEDATRRARVMVAAAENLVAVTRYEDADSLYARATRIFDRELGSDHRETSAARAALAHLRGEK